MMMVGNVYCRDTAALVALHSRRSSSGTMTSDTGASQVYTKVMRLAAPLLTPVWVLVCQLTGMNDPALSGCNNAIMCHLLSGAISKLSYSRFTLILFP